jgi:hypothetical protein
MSRNRVLLITELDRVRERLVGQVVVAITAAAGTAVLTLGVVRLAGDEIAHCSTPLISAISRA